MPARVSIDDLTLAAHWLDCYEGEDGDQRAAKTAAWLREEIARRQTEATVRQIVSETGLPAGRVRKAVRSRESAEPGST